MSYYRRKDLVKQAITTGGTDNRVIGAAATGYAGLAAADDGRTLTGTFRSGSSFETGKYVYTHSSLTLTRSLLIQSSSGAAVSISASGTFAESWTARDAELMGPADNYYAWSDFASSYNVLTGAADGTTDLRAAMAELQASMWANNGGDYHFLLNGNVRLDTACQETSGRNGQIILPTVSYVAGTTTPYKPQASLTISGRFNRNMVGIGISQSDPGYVEPNYSGRIRSTLTSVTGTYPSVICGANNPDVTDPSYPFSMLNLFLENLDIGTAGPSYGVTALNLGYVHHTQLKNVCVHSNTLNLNDITAAACGGLGRDHLAIRQQ
jgi:hypothetical protein